MNVQKKHVNVLSLSSVVVLILVGFMTAFFVFAHAAQQHASEQTHTAMQKQSNILVHKLKTDPYIRKEQLKHELSAKSINNFDTARQISFEFYEEAVRKAEEERIAAELKAQQEAEAARIAQEQVAQQQEWTAPQQDTSWQPYTPAETYGNIGRLKIPVLGINVALNSGDDSQWLVDTWDSAAYIPTGDSILIADHNDQGFASLNGCYVGMTGMICYPDGSIQYITCTDVTQGYHDGLVHVNGEWWPLVYPNSIMMYTCTYDWQHVFVTIWH